MPKHLASQEFIVFMVGITVCGNLTHASFSASSQAKDREPISQASMGALPAPRNPPVRPGPFGGCGVSSSFGRPVGLPSMQYDLSFSPQGSWSMHRIAKTSGKTPRSAA